VHASKPAVFSMDTPAAYQIRVRGIFDPARFDSFCSLRVLSSSRERNVTILTGTLPDQAAFLGVLNALYDLQIPLFSSDSEISENIKKHRTFRPTI